MFVFLPLSFFLLVPPIRRQLLYRIFVYDPRMPTQLE